MEKNQKISRRGIAFIALLGALLLAIGISNAATTIGTEVFWTSGVAVTPANYSVGRDLDGTNQLHFNVPSGASMEWSVQDAATMTMNATGLGIQATPGSNSALLVGSGANDSSAYLVELERTTTATGGGVYSILHLDHTVAPTGETSSPHTPFNIDLATTANLGFNLNQVGGVEIISTTDLNAANTVATFRGFNAQMTMNSGTAAIMQGYRARLAVADGGNVTDGRAFQSTVLNTSTGTVTKATGYYATANTNTGGGTLTDNYGVYIENQTAGTNDYGIYLVGADTYALWADSGSTRLDGRVLTAKGADIVSASTLTLGSDGNYFSITGTTTLNHITTTGWTTGSMIVLRFNGNITVTHNAGSTPASTLPMFLSGAANFSATDGDTLMLILDDTGWRETARTVI